MNDIGVSKSNIANKVEPKLRKVGSVKKTKSWFNVNRCTRINRNANFNVLFG
jgi:hypothetical protein